VPRNHHGVDAAPDEEIAHHFRLAGLDGHHQVVEDPVGLKAASAALQVVYQDTKDTIAIGTPAEGLAAVKALDSWKPVVSPLSV